MLEAMRHHMIPIAVGLLVFTGCRQEMADQPRYEPYEASGVFEDSMAMRRPVDGTVPREAVLPGRSGHDAGAGAQSQPGAGAESQPGAGAESQPGAGAESQPDADNRRQPGDAPPSQPGGGNAFQPTDAVPSRPGAGVATFAASSMPFPVTRSVLERGRERFNIYCAPCHGRAGDGRGIIVERGLRPPPSFHSERLRTAPDEHFYHVITEGFGAMFSYGSRVAPADRWAIVAYIRALQMSQHAIRSDLPPDSVALGRPGDAP